MTREPLLLVGAGGLAREVLAAIRSGDRWEPVGLLDDRPSAAGDEVDGLRVLGGTALVHDHPATKVVVCVANAHRPDGRRSLVRRLGLPPERYATVVHPHASLAPGVELGAGTVLLAGVVITTPLRVGSHVLAMPQVLLTHDDEVSDFVTMAGRASLAGGVRVGEAAYIGSGALIREGVSVGAEAVIGMGAVVLNDVPPGQTWAGVPARPLSTVSTPRLEAL
ncbi:acetyltransferase [Umezawaea endophytica]|uniref:Acetyltransferase n=1 Tax=Umezawaea endophytica TaxID=1654476 RepID=A0A9X2VSA6_9PSEU|nr:acetyltransferase [Umezawaea endophytica]MCS7481297.1 acetyltransferase [Umezawaea endophytica]